MHLRLLLVVLATAAAASARAATTAEPPPPPGADAFVGCKKYPPDKKFKWSVRGEVGVGELAASLGQISCKPIMVSSAIAQRGGKVAIEVPDLVTAADVYRLFYGALTEMGLTVDTAGGSIKIVDSGRAKEIATPELDGAAAGDDRYVVRLLHPKHASPQELAELLIKLKGKEGDVSVFGASSLVIIDRAANVRRMAEVVDALDIGEAGARIFTLQTHAQTPSELAGSLEKILVAATHRSGTAAPDPKSSAPKGAAATGIDGDVRALVPLDAARMLAVIGSDEGFARVQAIAARIDPPADDGAASQGHVLQLANTNAEDVAATLSSVGLSARTSSSSGSGGAGGTPRTPGAPTMVPSPTGGTLPLTGDVRIGADKTANALVIFANAADFATVRDLVAKLDVPRRQVYVETVILDLTVDRARTIGVSWHQTATNGDNSVNAFVGNQSSTLVSWSPTSLAAAAAGGGVGGGLFAGVLGKSFTLFGQSIPSFGVALQALEHTKDTNIISRPQLMTMDNTKATISVGQQIVYQTQSLGALTTGTTTPSVLNSYARQPVALTLELTPHLNESDSIRLEINGNIEDLADGSTSPGGPTTNQRKIQTAVVVQDGETIVLGGLTKEMDTQQIDKIPGLGDIPLIGRLFQTRNKERVKQELLIIMTPYIIRSRNDVRRIAEQKERDRQDYLERYSAFADEGQYDAHVDYRRKRGLLEEVNQTALAAAREGDALRAAEKALKPPRTDGAISLAPVDEHR